MNRKTHKERDTEEQYLRQHVSSCRGGSCTNTSPAPTFSCHYSKVSQGLHWEESPFQNGEHLVCEGGCMYEGVGKVCGEMCVRGGCVMEALSRSV